MWVVQVLTKKKQWKVEDKREGAKTNSTANLQ